MSKLNSAQTYGIAGISAARVGRVVVMTIALGTNLPELFSSAVVATLPVGMRPGYFDVSAPCMVRDAAASCMVTVKTNGQVLLLNQGATPSGSHIKVAFISFLTPS